MSGNVLQALVISLAPSRFMFVSLSDGCLSTGSSQLLTLTHKSIHFHRSTLGFCFPVGEFFLVVI